MLSRPGFHIITTLNPQIIVEADRHPQLKAMIQKSLCIADGDGVALLAGVQKIAGITLVEAIIKEKKYRIYFIGGTPEVAQKTTLYGAHHGYFQESDIPHIIKELQEKKPDFVLVGMGVPKQEAFLHTLTTQLTYGIGIGVGGTFDVLTGEKKRAPDWCISLHIEWLYRGLTEPKRIKTWSFLIRYLVKWITFSYNPRS
jgi:N-acetylglucosaminyldiphosphoundecaprenol N-acetyl-beta-D-mannosaminyltransferase